MDPEEYFASQGRLISEEDLQVGRGGGAAGMHTPLPAG